MAGCSKSEKCIIGNKHREANDAQITNSVRFCYNRISE